MKLCYLAVAFFAAGILLNGCVKNDDPTGTSTGTLQSAVTGDCSPVVVNGVYMVDSILTSNNYVDVQVNVTVGGSFEIKSDSINGYTFKKSGTVSAGLNTIRLYASGKPIATGTNTFTVVYGGTACNFTVTVFAAGGGFGTALYTLGGSPGNCSVSSITGNYIVGVPMTAANKVQTTVNVNTPGTYNITGTAINGVTFSSSGVFTNPGIQNIFLSASGTPTGPGIFTYPVYNGATNCNFSITYNTVITNATYALSGSPGNCTSAAVNGTYSAGLIVNASNNVVINVNVTSTGNYSISTPVVNGISFSATGTFNITGPQQVILTASGTPIASGPFTYPLTGGGNTCSFSVNTGATGVFTCKIDGVFTDFSTEAVAKTIEPGPGNGPYLHLLGYKGPSGASVPNALFWILNNNASPVLPGSYDINGYLLPANGYKISINYELLDPGPGIYLWSTFSNANVPPPSNPPFTIVVTSVTATRAIGTFSGQIQNTSAPGPLPNKVITEGVFNLPVQN
jgi:hypothetical protein